jgi:predicted MFS family arabinose efflux permease
LSEAGGSTKWAPLGSRAGLRLLQLAAFFSSFDRFAVAPMLVTIAASLGASLSEVAATASLYYLLYGGCSLCGGCYRTGSGGCA